MVVLDAALDLIGFELAGSLVLPIGDRVLTNLIDSVAFQLQFDSSYPFLEKILPQLELMVWLKSRQF